MTEEVTAYFGCYGKAGHYLFFKGHQFSDRHPIFERHHIPRPGQLDGSMLFLPKVEKVGHGALTYLPAIDRTILAWWGNPWDKRPNTNSAVICSGKVSLEEMWDRFEKEFPNLVSYLSIPIIVASYETSKTSNSLENKVHGPSPLK